MKLNRNELVFEIVLVAFLLICAFDVKIGRLNVFPLSFNMTTARAALLAVCAMSVSWFLKGLIPDLWSHYRPILRWSAVFMATMALSALLSAYPGVGIERCVFYGAFIYLFLICICLPYQGVLDRMPIYLFYTGIVLGALGFAERFSPGLRDLLESTFIPGGGSFLGLSSSSLQNPIIFGCFMLISLLCGWFKRNEIGVYIAVPACCLFVSGIMFSGSRLAVAGFVCALLAIAFSLLVRGRRFLSAVTFAGLALALFLAMHFAVPAADKIKYFPERLRDTLASAANLEEFSSRRLSIWKAAFVMWNDHRLLGVGPGAYGAYLAHYEQYSYLGGAQMHPHNLFIRVFCEVGLIGFAAFIMLAYCIGKRVFALGLKGYAVPAITFLLFELFEEFLRDAFPSLVFILLVAYAIRSANLNMQSQDPLRANNF